MRKGASRLPRSWSHPLRHRSSMRCYPDQPDPGTLLAGFGEARLMHYLDGRVEMVGGTDADRKVAFGWLARFCPDTRLGEPKPPPWPRRK